MAPGDKLYIDFCRQAFNFLTSTRENRGRDYVQVFVSLSSYSTMVLPWRCQPKGTDDFIHATQCCFEEI